MTTLILSFYGRGTGFLRIQMRSPPIPDTLLKILFTVVINAVKAYLPRKHVSILIEKNNLAVGYLMKCFFRSFHEWYRQELLLLEEKFELCKKIKTPEGLTCLNILQVTSSFSGKSGLLYREHDRTKTQSNCSGNSTVSISATAKLIPKCAYIFAAIPIPTSDISIP